jgi:hypothetical protein
LSQTALRALDGCLPNADAEHIVQHDRGVPQVMA